MNILVTGATGFLGSHLAKALVAQGHTVRILRRQSSKLDALGDTPVEHVIGDLNTVTPEMLMGIDWVFHTAAVADYWRTAEDMIYKVNVEGTRQLLDAAQAAGVKRFIFTSSAAAIGFRHDGHTATEADSFDLRYRWLSPYGHSKHLAEQEVFKAIEQGLDAVILNPTVILGPGDINLISGSIVLEAAKGMLMVMPQQGGTNFIDVRDVVKMSLAAAEKGRCGERYLLGTINMTHKAMLKLTCSIVGAPMPKIPVPRLVMPAAARVVDLGRSLGIDIPADGNQIRMSARDIYFDCRKAWRELVEPEISIQQSIADTYQWYKAHSYL